MSIAALLLGARGALGADIYEAAQSDTCKDGNHHLGLVQLHAQSLTHVQKEARFSDAVDAAGEAPTTAVVTPAPAIPGSKPGPLISCTKQMGCLQWEFTEGPIPGTCSTGDCEWTVCVTLSLSADGCVKSASDSISHVCEKDDATCTPAQVL